MTVDKHVTCGHRLIPRQFVGYWRNRRMEWQQHNENRSVWTIVASPPPHQRPDQPATGVQGINQVGRQGPGLVQ